MSSLAVFIQNRNEKDDLVKCIRSLQDIGDNIYLIDLLNSAKADEICRTYKIGYLHGNQSSFHDQINNSANVTGAEYILFLHSNEYVSGHLKNSLLSMKDRLIYDRYGFNICKNYYGRWMKHSGLYPDYQVRLCKRNTSVLTDKSIQTKSDPGKTHGIEVIPGELYCIEHRSIRDHINQVNIDTDLLANYLLEKGKKTNSFKLIFKPFCQFFRLFIIKLGFLDGYYGFVCAIISGYSCFLMQVKLKYLYRTI